MQFQGALVDRLSKGVGVRVVGRIRNLIKLDMSLILLNVFANGDGCMK